MTLSADDQRLLDETDESVSAEREATVRVLKNFLEIDRRRIYSALRKSSLRDFVMERYKFSGDEADRRIKAMQVLKEVPQVEEKIESGALTMTHIGLAQSLFRHESRNHARFFSKAEKLRVLERMENTTTREAQRMTFSMASSPMFKTEDKIRPISQDEVEFKYKGPKRLEDKLEKLKGWLAHSHPNISMADLIEKLCDLGTEHWDPSREPAITRKRATQSKENSAAPREICSRKGVSAPRRAKRVTISPRTKREIWQRDKSCCSNCGSTYALQIDHIKPVAMGGDNSAENLRLLCRSCNQRAAIENLGLAQMQMHF